MDTLRFTDELLTRKRPSGVDVDTTLSHFAIVTYLVAPDVLRRHVHTRFELDVINHNGFDAALLHVPEPFGSAKFLDRWHPPTGFWDRLLVSVVPFVDQDFRFSKFPWLKRRFGQTNYRAYVTDTETGEHVVWFSEPRLIPLPFGCHGTFGNSLGTRQIFDLNAITT